MIFQYEVAYFANSDCALTGNESSHELSHNYFGFIILQDKLLATIIFTKVFLDILHLQFFNTDMVLC